MILPETVMAPSPLAGIRLRNDQQKIEVPKKNVASDVKIACPIAQEGDAEPPQGQGNLRNYIVSNRSVIPMQEGSRRIRPVRLIKESDTEQ